MKTLILFGSPSCTPCKHVENYLTQAKVPFEKLLPEAGADAGVQIQGIPTLVLFDKDTPISSVQGFDLKRIKNLVKELEA